MKCNLQSYWSLGQYLFADYIKKMHEKHTHLVLP